MKSINHHLPTKRYSLKYRQYAQVMSQEKVPNIKPMPNLLIAFFSVFFLFVFCVSTYTHFFFLRKPLVCFIFFSLFCSFFTRRITTKETIHFQHFSYSSQNITQLTLKGIIKYESLIICQR